MSSEPEHYPGSSDARWALVIHAFHSFGAQTIARVAVFIAGIALARFLAPQNLGIFALLLTLASAISAYSSLNIPQAVAKFSAEGGRGNIALVLSGMGWLTGLSVVAMIGLTLASSWIADAYGEPSLGEYLPAIAIFACVTNMQAGAIAFLQGLGLLKYYNVTIILAAILNLVLVSAGAWIAGLSGAVWGNALSATMSLTIAIGAVWYSGGFREQNFRARELVTGAARIFGFSLPIVLGGVAGATANWMAASLLVKAHGFHAMGDIRVANSLAANLVLVAVAIGVPLFPTVARNHIANREKFVEAAKDSFRLTTLLTYPLSIFLILFSDIIIAILFGAEYHGASTVLQVLSVAGFFMALNNNAGALFYGTGKTMFAFYMNAGWGLLFVLLSMVLVQSQGALGYALAMLLAYFVLIVVQLIYQERYWDIHFKRFTGTLVALAFGFLAAFFIPYAFTGSAFVVTALLLMSVVAFVELRIVRFKILTEGIRRMVDSLATTERT